MLSLLLDYPGEYCILGSHHLRNTSFRPEILVKEEEMAGWYEVQEGDEVAHVRATNTRTAFDRGFRLLCGMDYKLPPGQKMTMTVLRLRGGTEKVKFLEQVYQESRNPVRKRVSVYWVLNAKDAR
jgi:hypothetical protein